MFDTVEIGKRIARLRREKDMTQPALADIMGVSFQAVSNWERGASMPDIGKLPQLAETLGVSLDELLGGGRGSELISHVLDGSEGSYIKESDVSIEDAETAAPVLKPRQLEHVVHLIADGMEEEESEGERKPLRLASVAALAPYLDEETLGELAERITEEYGFAQLASIAPFLAEKTLGEMAEQAAQRGVRAGELAAIAPFLEDETLDALTEKLYLGGARVGELASIAPFLSEQALGKLAERACEDGVRVGELASIAPFLDEDTIDALVVRVLNSGAAPEELLPLAPFLSEKTLCSLLKAGRRKKD